MTSLGIAFILLSLGVIVFYLYVRYTEKHHPKHH